MKNALVPEGILFKDWTATPVLVRELIFSLQGTVEQLSQHISESEEQINKRSNPRLNLYLQ